MLQLAIKHTHVAEAALNAITYTAVKSLSLKLTHALGSGNGAGGHSSLPREESTAGALSTAHLLHLKDEKITEIPVGFRPFLSRASCCRDGRREARGAAVISNPRRRKCGERKRREKKTGEVVNKENPGGSISWWCAAAPSPPSPELVPLQEQT